MAVLVVLVTVYHLHDDSGMAATPYSSNLPAHVVIGMHRDRRMQTPAVDV